MPMLWTKVHKGGGVGAMLLRPDAAELEGSAIGKWLVSQCRPVFSKLDKHGFSVVRSCRLINYFIHQLIHELNNPLEN